MKGIMTTVIAAVCAATAMAQMKVNRPASGHRYYYQEGFLIPSQAWDGSPFVVEADLTPPPRDFSRDAWFGLCVDDTEHKERYIFGGAGFDGKNDPQVFALASVCYARKPGTVKRLKQRWDRAEGRLTVRVKWDGAKLFFSRRLKDGSYEDLDEIVPVEGFKPLRLGVNCESYAGTGPTRDFECHAFRVLEGTGPAKSDPLDGTAPVPWRLGSPHTERFVEYPHPLVLSWNFEPENPSAYDLGTDAKLPVRAKTWIYGGKTAKLAWRCTDFWDREVADGETSLTLVKKESVFGTIDIPAAKLPRNGIYKITVNPSVDGKALPELYAQFAVIPPRTVKPFDYDPSSPYTINYLMGGSWNLSGRVGAKSLRMPYWSEDAFDRDYQLLTDKARENGILLNGPILQVHHSDLPAENEAEAKRIAGVFDRLAKKYPDLIRAQELFNEPEGLMKGTTELTAYCSMSGKIKRELKALGSPVKFIGTGPLHCNLDYLMRVAITGGRDAVDVITTHGYRSPCRPEFGYDEDVKAIKAIYGDDGRDIVCDEDTYFTYVPGERVTVDDKDVTMTSPTHTLNELDQLTHGVYIQRKFLNQLMAGYTKINQFNALDNHQVAWKLDYQRPGLVTYAALSWLMAHPKFARRLTEPTDHLWALEWTSDKDTFLTFWAMDDLHEVTVKGRDLRVYDTFANEIAAGDSVTFVAGVAPVYVKGAKMTIAKRALTDRLPAVPLPEDAPLSAKPYDASIVGHATGMKSAVVEVAVKNNSGRDDTFAVRPAFIGKDAAAWGFEPKELKAALKAGETKVFAFTPVSFDAEKPFDPSDPGVNYTALWWTEGYQIGAVVEVGGEKRSFYNTRQLGLRGIPKADGIVIDAEEDAAWASVPTFKEIGGARRRNAGLGNYGWYSKYSFCPEFKFAWCEKGLLFYAKVLDERHDVSQKGIDAWRTDSIQLGLTGSWRKPDHTDWPLLTFSLANKEVYLQRDTATLKAGPLKEIEYATKRIDGSYETSGTTVYEALIPWSVLGLDPKTTKTFGYSIIFNQSIGFWRQGWEGYFAPLGGQIVDPTCFGDLTICE